MSRRAGLDTPAVVEAAAALVEAAGYDELTLAALAEKLRVRIPSLYNHITGLESLRRALARQALEQLTSALTASVVGRAGDEGLLALGDAYRAFAREHPGLYAALMRAPTLADESLTQQALDAPVQVVTRVLDAYGLQGNDARYAVRAFRSIAHGFVSLEISGCFGHPEDLDASYHRLLCSFIGGLRAAQ